jgi:hypothetical protein
VLGQAQPHPARKIRLQSSDRHSFSNLLFSVLAKDLSSLITKFGVKTSHSIAKNKENSKKIIPQRKGFVKRKKRLPCGSLGGFI